MAKRVFDKEVSWASQEKSRTLFKTKEWEGNSDIFMVPLPSQVQRAEGGRVMPIGGASGDCEMLG